MEGKTFVFDNAGGGSDNSAAMMAMMSGMLNKSGVDPNVLAMMSNGGMGGQNGMFMLLFLILLLGRGGEGLFGAGGAAQALNTAENSQLLLQAINGNGNAVRDLAAATNTSISNVQNALNGLSSQVATWGCDLRSAINEQGFQARLSEVNQTNALQATMNANQAQTNAGFAAIEASRQADRIRQVEERNQALTFELSQRTQNDYLTAQIRPIYNELERIRARELPVYSQPYLPGLPVPVGGGGAVAFGGYPFGYGGGCCHQHHCCPPPPVTTTDTTTNP